MSTYWSTPLLTIQTENTTFITSTTQTHNIRQHSKEEKNTILTTAAIQQTFPQTPHSHYIRHKNNMRHIHTSIVSRHLATRGNNNILCTPPPHISSSEERFPTSLVAPFPNSEQTNLPSSNHTYTKSHLSPLCTLCNTHTYAPPCHPWSHGAAGQMERYAGWWTKIGMIALPPQTRVKGVGRHNHNYSIIYEDEIMTYHWTKKQILKTIEGKGACDDVGSTLKNGLHRLVMHKQIVLKIAYEAYILARQHLVYF